MASHTYPPNTNNLIASTRLGPGFQGENARRIHPPVTATGIHLNVLGVQVLRFKTLIDDRGKPSLSFLTDWYSNVPSINLASLINSDDLVELEDGVLEKRQTVLDWAEIMARSGTIHFQGVAPRPVPSSSQPSIYTVGADEPWLTMRAWPLSSLLLFPFQFILAVICCLGPLLVTACLVGFVLTKHIIFKIVCSFAVGGVLQLALVVIWTKKLQYPPAPDFYNLFPLWWRTSRPIVGRLAVKWFAPLKRAVLWFGRQLLKGLQILRFFSEQFHII